MEHRPNIGGGHYHRARQQPLSYNLWQYKRRPPSPRQVFFSEFKAAMKPTHYCQSIAFGLLALLAIGAASLSHADDYSNVSQLMQSGKLSEALTKADNYLVGKPRDPQMRFLKGVIQRNAGKSVEAIDTFTKLTQDYPELPEPYNNLAVLYASSNQFDKARAALEMAIRTNPSYATAHENLGDVYARLASQAYNKALQLDAGNAAVPPKLALIRELFSPTNKGQHPALTPAAKPTAVVPAVAAINPVKQASTAVPASSTRNTPPEEVAPNADSKQVQAAVQNWAKAWAAKDVETYLKAYSKDFVPAGKTVRSVWEAERRQRILSKTTIQVKIENLTISIKDKVAVAKFRQSYRAGALAVSSRKRLELTKSGAQWLIVNESIAS